MSEPGETLVNEDNGAIETKTPFFEYRVLFTHKDVPEGFEDGFCVDPLGGCAAIADGVASGIYSKAWADVLTQQFVADRPDPSNQLEFNDWIMKCRKVWSKRIPSESQRPWNEEMKLQQFGGGFATFLSICAERNGDQYDVGVFAVGDCNLFHIRGRELLLSFPMQKPEDFRTDPVSFASFGSRMLADDSDHNVSLLAMRGDLLILATDAIAEYLLEQSASQDVPNWEGFLTIPEDQWLAEVSAARESRVMRFDDITLLVTRLDSVRDDSPLVPGETEPIVTSDECVADDVLAVSESGKELASGEETTSEAEIVQGLQEEQPHVSDSDEDLKEL